MALANGIALCFSRAEDALLALKGGAVKEAGTMLEECEEFVKKHEAEDIEPVVHSTYYSCYAAYLKVCSRCASPMKLIGW